MSRGMEPSAGYGDERVKQSSISGSVGPSVKVWLAVMLGYGSGPDVGIPPASTGR